MLKKVLHQQNKRAIMGPGPPPRCASGTSHLAAAWPVRAVLSDKQVGLPAAIQTVFPGTVHQFCQAHYVARLAAPLEPADVQLASVVRKAVRAGVGVYLRADTPTPSPASAVLTVTGLLPSSPLSTDPPLTDAALPAAPATDATLPPSSAAAQDLVRDVLRRVRYLLTLSGHRPDGWAGLDMVAGLEEILRLCQQLVTHRGHAVLTALVATLETALRGVADDVGRLRQVVRWLTDIRALLDPGQTPALTGAAGAAALSAYLERLAHETGGDPFLAGLMEHLWGVSRRYWPGLFHTYDQHGLPRTTNDVEGRFRELRRRLGRTTGQAGQTRAATPTGGRLGGGHGCGHARRASGRVCGRGPRRVATGKRVCGPTKRASACTAARPPAPRGNWSICLSTKTGWMHVGYKGGKPPDLLAPFRPLAPLAPALAISAARSRYRPGSSF